MELPSSSYFDNSSDSISKVPLSFDPPLNFGIAFKIPASETNAQEIVVIFLRVLRPLAHFACKRPQGRLPCITRYMALALYYEGLIRAGHIHDYTENANNLSIRCEQVQTTAEKTR